MATDIEQPGLFAEPAPVEPAPEPSPGEKRRARHLAVIARGQHPLSIALGYPIRLHPEARRDGDRTEDGSPRCGGCVHRRVVATNGNRSWPKCLHGQRWETRAATHLDRRLQPDRESYAVLVQPRVSHGQGTDVASWWPACTDYQPAPPEVTT